MRYLKGILKISIIFILLMVCLGAASADNSTDINPDYDWDYGSFYVGGDCDFISDENYALNYNFTYVVGGDCDLIDDEYSDWSLNEEDYYIDDLDLDFEDDLDDDYYLDLDDFDFDDLDDEDYDLDWEDFEFDDLDDEDYDLDWDDFEFDDLDDEDYDLDWDDFDFDDLDDEDYYWNDSDWYEFDFDDLDDEDYDWNDTDCDGIDLDESRECDYATACPILSCCLDDESDNIYLGNDNSGLNDLTGVVSAVGVADTNSTDDDANITVSVNQKGDDSQDSNILVLVLMMVIMVLSII